MGYCYHLYTPDMEERDNGKFVVCDKLLLSNNTIANTTIGFYQHFLSNSFLDIYNSVIILDEDQCRLADEYTGTTFFTDFIKLYDCNGMLIKIT